MLLLLLLLPLGHGAEQHNQTIIAARIPGDLVLGGLFPVHGQGQPCGAINEERGIQRLEAMLYTLDRINADDRILPGITLGAHILDTCSRDTYALEQALEFVRAKMTSLGSEQFSCNDGSAAVSLLHTKPVVGVIGASDSTVSLQVANLLRLFKIPQISFASTSAALSDKSRFEFFARTVPPDTFQSKAIADIVRALNFTYVATVASAGEYGESGIEMFQKEARLKNICIAAQEKVPLSPSPKHFDAIIAALDAKTNARAVVLFTRMEHALGILEAANRAQLVGRFVWIASDHWGTQDRPVKGREYVAEGALTVELQSHALPDFDKHLRELRPFDEASQRNPWFREFWESRFNCRVDPALAVEHKKSVCSSQQQSPHYVQDTKVQFVSDAVLAMALALDNIRKRVCGDEYGPCRALQTVGGDVLFREILNISFPNLVHEQVGFDENGDGIGRYDILNFQLNRATRRWEYRKVGVWEETLRLNMADIVWAGGSKLLPASTCSEPCGQGEAKSVQQGDVCCWRCLPCRDHEFLVDEFTCHSCGAGSWPLADRRGCQVLPEQYIQWHSVFAIVPILLALLGVLTTSAVLVTFAVKNDTPVVKASGRELCYILLAGILFCYLQSFVLLAKPSAATCGLQRVGVGLGFALMYSALLTKTNRISRVFESASKSTRRPSYISPRSQVLICSLLISVQGVATAIWLVVEPPDTRLFTPEGRFNTVILKCKVKETAFFISLIYNMLLIVVCTVYAVKTRNLPENFNESKFIAFTMYTTCVIWLAFIPLYFGTMNNHEIQTTALCVSISLSATVALSCLFAPKMYIIYLQPEKNSRVANIAKQAMQGSGKKALFSAKSLTDEQVQLNPAREGVKLYVREARSTDVDELNSGEEEAAL